MAVDYDATTYFYDEWGRACLVRNVVDVNSFDIGVYDYEIDIWSRGDEKTICIEWEDGKDCGAAFPHGVGWYKNVDGERKRVLYVSNKIIESNTLPVKYNVTIWYLENDEKIMVESSIQHK